MTRKRWRTPVAKPGELKVVYGRADRHSGEDLVAAWGGEGAARADGRMILSMIHDKRMGYTFPDMKLVDNPSLVEELEARGYDITTLRISIQQKAADSAG